MRTKTLSRLALAGALLSTASAQGLMVPESTNDTVMLFDEMDGSLINATFIDLTTSAGTAPATPIEAKLAPNGEILISDQIADVIFRWSGDGTTYLGESTTPLDNMRGFEIAGGSIWVANAGTIGGAPGPSPGATGLKPQLCCRHFRRGQPI